MVGLWRQQKLRLWLIVGASCGLNGKGGAIFEISHDIER